VKRLVIIIVIFTSLVINYVIFLFFNVGNHSLKTTYKIKIKTASRIKITNWYQSQFS
jgi:5-bromo-4-chloroindolyl phosphate hydrolysis protein